MKNAARRRVVRLYTKRFLGAYSDARGRERIPETARFFAGVILTMALPQLICTAYGGFIPFIAFAATASAGTLIGWAMYRQASEGAASCVGARDTPRAPRSEPAANRKAA